MNKEDMIYDLLNKIDNKLDKHISNVNMHGRGMTVKEWSIVAGIITTICSTVLGIFKIIS